MLAEPRNLLNSAMSAAARVTSRGELLRLASSPCLTPPPITSSHLAKKRSVTVSIPPRRKESKLKSLSETQVNPWIITDLSVRPVPRFYPLQQTSIRPIGIPVKVLAERISRFCRVNSIATTFDNDNASAKAMSPNHVKFTITLWRGNDGVAGSSSDIILEANKSSGCSVDFHQICRGLFQAATTPKTPIIYGTPDWRVNDDILRTTDNINKTETSEELLGVLPITIGLLFSENIDSNHLGMENLCVLADPVSVQMGDACYVCRALLFGEEPYGMLREAVLRYVKANDPEEAGVQRDEIEDCWTQHVGTMQSLALRALASSFRVSSADGSLSLGLVEHCDFWLEAIMPTLVRVVGEARDRPLDAALSAACLGALTRNLTEASKRELLSNTFQLLVEAYEHGKGRHLLLEQETLNLLTTLGAPAHLQSESDEGGTDKNR